MKNKTSNILWGLVFIVIGLGFAGNTFDLWYFELFFDGWWTLFIIVPCVISLAQNGFNTGSIIGLVIGVILLLSAQGILPEGVLWKLMIPVILILIGVSLIFKDTLYHNKVKAKINFNYNSKGPDYSAIFSGQKIVFAHEPFTGASINAIFGGVDLNLRDAIITEDVVMDCNAIFGGVDIFVPSTINVKVSSVPIFGGVSNKTNRALDPSAPTLFINATCMFGGIDIK
ncbi:MAG: cell wall-active antibiotics response protein [Clostridiales bacterium]|nr:cell wall-active antibiotics response protein [Clostridiales bacterium]